MADLRPHTLQYNFGSSYSVLYVHGIQPLLHLGEKLRKLLMEHGDWDGVEANVKQWAEDKNKSKKQGGYVTKQWLMDNRSYTKCLR